MTGIENLRTYLPSEWVESLLSLPPEQQAAIQEIRLRANQPVTLSTPQGERFLFSTRMASLQQPNAVVCRQDMLEGCFLRFCEQSVYAHEEELRQGYIAVAGGIRVGIAGTAVLDGECVCGVRQITSLCVRLPRAHTGCAATLLPLLYAADGVQSTLIVGEPSSGKTSLLRDIATSLAARRVRVAVVDERGELSGVDGLDGCDVLRGYPKAKGILQAVRCLAPQVVVFDELGDAREQAAVAACAHAGVAVVASLHGHSPSSLAQKPMVRRLVEQRTFEQWVFLQGRHAPSLWRACYFPEVEAGEIVWYSADSGGGDWYGHGACSPPVSAGGLVACRGVLFNDLRGQTHLYSGTAGRFVADAGGWRKHSDLSAGKEDSRRLEAGVGV